MPKDINFWSIIASRFFLLMAAAALVIVGIGVSKGIIRYTELQQEISKIERDISKLESKNQELNRLITYLTTPEFKEKAARLQLNLQKPGEHVIIIPGADGEGDNEISLIVPKDATKTKEANWRQWLNYFFP